MGYSALPTRTSSDPNSSADVNQLQENIKYQVNKLSLSDNYSVSSSTPYNLFDISSVSTSPSIVLPTISACFGRVLKYFHSAQASSNTVTLNRTGTDPIVDSLTSIVLSNKGDYVNLYASSITGAWEILEHRITNEFRVDTFSTYGSAQTKIMQFANKRYDLGNFISNNHGAYGTAGLNVEIHKSGRYSGVFTCDSASPGFYVGISLNTSQTTIDIYNINVLNQISYSSDIGTQIKTASFSQYFKKGDIIMPHTSGQTASFEPIFIISYDG